MAVYIKRLIVLKQVNGGYSTAGKVVSGIVKIEESECSTQISISLLNLSAVQSGEYYVAVKGDKDSIIVKELGSYPMTVNFSADTICDIKGGVGMILLHVEEQTVFAVAYGSSGNCSVGINDLKNKFVADYLIPKLTPKISYADEIIADNDYYSEVAATTELTNKSEQPSINVSEMPYTFDGFSNAFYNTVKNDIEGMLKNYPPNEILNKAVPMSRWVNISYGDNKYYTVGVIYQNSTPKYICYGVPGKYSKTPPKALEGYASFLPVSLFDMKGEGYWMMYQSAISGECVKVQIIE